MKCEDCRFGHRSPIAQSGCDSELNTVTLAGGAIATLGQGSRLTTLGFCVEAGRVSLEQRVQSQWVTTRVFLPGECVFLSSRQAYGVDSEQRIRGLDPINRMCEVHYSLLDELSKSGGCGVKTLFEAQAHQLNEARLVVSLSSVQGVVERVAQVLVNLLQPDGALATQCRKTIAQLASTGEESVSRALRQLVDQGLIEVNRRMIRVPKSDQLRSFLK